MPKDISGNHGSSNERYIWAIFCNCPSAEALALYAEATKILTARNILKPPRKPRTPKTSEQQRAAVAEILSKTK